MARVCVLAAPGIEAAPYYLARAHADALVELGRARRIKPRLIQLNPTCPIVRCRKYIPERMPPVDLPGLHFVEPDSATWKRQHRAGNGHSKLFQS